MYTAFLGTCRCFRCKTDSEAYIQTYLFKTDAQNASHEYGVGESEIIDGLDDFWPLHPWNGQSPLVIAVGDWHCQQCGQHMQWAKVTLSVSEPSKMLGGVELRLGLVGRIESIETLVPRTLDALDGVHFAKIELAALSGLFDEKFDWSACSVEQRCSLVVTGFRRWCTEIADVNVDDES